MEKMFCSVDTKITADPEKCFQHGRQQAIRVTCSSVAIPAAIYRSAQGPGPEKCPTECFLSNFGHLARSAPKSALWVLFWRSLGRKKRQKALKKHSLRHSEPGAQNCSRSTPSGTFRPKPVSTPVNGGGDRNSSAILQATCCSSKRGLKPLGQRQPP